MNKLRPYFLTNKDWYEYDEDGMIVMKEIAPIEALKSFEAFNRYSEGKETSAKEIKELSDLIYQPQLQEQNEFEKNKGIFGL